MSGSLRRGAGLHVAVLGTIRQINEPCGQVLKARRRRSSSFGNFASLTSTEGQRGRVRSGERAGRKGRAGRRLSYATIQSSIPSNARCPSGITEKLALPEERT